MESRFREIRDAVALFGLDHPAVRLNPVAQTSAGSTGASDPSPGDGWCAAGGNASFPHATACIGDYSNSAATADGHGLAYWTDLRETACFAGACRSGEDAYFTAAP